MTLEYPVKGFSHYWRTTNPDALYLFRICLSELVLNEAFIPSGRVDLLLGKTCEELEVVHLVSLAVGIESLEQF